MENVWYAKRKLKIKEDGTEVSGFAIVQENQIDVFYDILSFIASVVWKLLKAESEILQLSGTLQLRIDKLPGVVSVT